MVRQAGKRQVLGVGPLRAIQVAAKEFGQHVLVQGPGVFQALGAVDGLSAGNWAGRIAFGDPATSLGDGAGAEMQGGVAQTGVGRRPFGSVSVARGGGRPALGLCDPQAFTRVNGAG